MNPDNRNNNHNRSNQNKRRSTSQAGRSGQSNSVSRSEGKIQDRPSRRGFQGESQRGSQKGSRGESRGESQGGPQRGYRGESQGGSRGPKGKFQGGTSGTRGKARRPHGKSRSAPYSSQDREQSRSQNIEIRTAGPEDRLEGRNPIKEALRAGRNINKIWIKRRDSGRYDQDLTRLIQDGKKAGAVIVEVDGDVLDNMATSYGHQGIIAQVAAHEYVSLTDLIARGEEQMADNSYPLLILLDGLEESYNLGSILRIADAAGATGIIIPERRSVALDAAVAKASAGAIEYVPVARVTNLSNTIQELKDSGYWVYGAEAQGAATPEDSDWLRKVALVIGSEGKGMGMKVTAACDLLISIPQYGHVNSLNAAVACGILVFEAKRQARQSAEGAKPSSVTFSEQILPGENLSAESIEV